MGNTQDTYADDPYIKQANSANNPLNAIYSQSTIPYSNLDRNTKLSMNVLSSQQEIKKTTVYKNPIKIDLNSFNLQKDVYSPNVYYISFKYSSERNITAVFYFNTEFIPKPVNGSQYFIPSAPFRNCITQKVLHPGIDQVCMEADINIDTNYFLNYKSYSSTLTDLVMELYALDQNNNIECILASFCKIVMNNNNVMIKPMMQKCKVYNSDWYDIQNIYGLSSQDKLCEICCTNDKNTYFLPCRHSYTCKECAIMLRVRGEMCPLCRQEITDSVVIETTGFAYNTNSHS